MTEADKLTTANEAIWKREMVSRPYGGSGLLTISDTEARTGLNVYCITPVTDTVFNTLTGATGFSVTGKTGRVCPAGIPIFGRFTAITLSYGEVDCNLLASTFPE